MPPMHVMCTYVLDRTTEAALHHALGGQDASNFTVITRRIKLLLDAANKTRGFIWLNGAPSKALCRPQLVTRSTRNYVEMGMENNLSRGCSIVDHQVE